MVERARLPAVPETAVFFEAFGEAGEVGGDTDVASIPRIDTSERLTELPKDKEPPCNSLAMLKLSQDHWY